MTAAGRADSSLLSSDKGPTDRPQFLRYIDCWAFCLTDRIERVDVLPTVIASCFYV